MLGVSSGVTWTIQKLDNTESLAQLPEEYRRRIPSHVVNISGVTPYFRRRWEIFARLVEAQLQRVGPNRYKLRPPFFQTFRTLLLDLLSQERKAQLAPPDMIAEALAWAANDSEPDKDAVSRNLEYVPLDEAEEEAIDEDWPFILRRPDPKPISEEWRELGDHLVPWLDPLTLSTMDFKKWERGYRGDALGLINLVPSYINDRTKHPKLAIEIEGAPVCLLMKASGPGTVNAATNEDENAKILWNALLKWLSVQVGFAEPAGGRPARETGRWAALLHDYYRYSWPKVAQIPTRDEPDPAFDLASD